jgi:hypothetical protein
MTYIILLMEHPFEVPISDNTPFSGRSWSLALCVGRRCHHICHPSAPRASWDPSGRQLKVSRDRAEARLGLEMPRRNFQRIQRMHRK